MRALELKIPPPVVALVIVGRDVGHLFGDVAI